MANSVVKVIESDLVESLTLIVGEDGIITPDKDTALSILGKRPTTDLNILYMNKSAGHKLDVTLDTLMYIHSDEVEDADYNMDEVSRNLKNMQLDHDYSLFTSPETEEEVDLDDELAQTLSLLDGNLPDDEVEQKMSLLNSRQRDRDASNKKLEATASTTKVVKSARMISTNQKLVKSAPKASEIAEKLVPKETKEEIEEDEEVENETPEEEDSEDTDDSDFILEDEKPKTPRRVHSKRSVLTEKASKPPKSVKTPTIKLAKQIGGKQMPKTATISSAVSSTLPASEKSTKDAVVADVDSEQVVHEQKVKWEGIGRVVEKKAQPPKKEKKPPKPIPDDFALFSTPDIIRRVGSGKEPSSTLPTTSQPPPLIPIQQHPKPAKISAESRSRTTSIESKTATASTQQNKHSHKRHSSDSKLSTQTTITATTTIQQSTSPRRRSTTTMPVSSSLDPRTKSSVSSSLDPRCKPVVSSSLDPRTKSVVIGDLTTNQSQVSVQEFDCTTNSESDSLENNSNSVAELQPIPDCVEDIRAIIQSDSTKSFTTYEDSTSADNTSNATTTIDPPPPPPPPLPPPSSCQPTNQNPPSSTQSTNHNVPNPIAPIDSSTVNNTLDHIDQTLLLDNLSSDLISDDILYQVAQSLVDNTVLQNAIDKMEVDHPTVSGLMIAATNQGMTGATGARLIAANQGLVTAAGQTPVGPIVLNHMQMADATALLQQQQQQHHHNISVPQQQQIIRPDGRVITLPPVERPTTRSRNKRDQQQQQQQQHSPMTAITQTSKSPAAATILTVTCVTTPPPQPPPITASTTTVTSSAVVMMTATKVTTSTTAVRQIKTPVKPLDDDHVSGNELDSSSSGGEEEGDEEDPHKLWCICNQPHNNRFMICCDTCEEWYHGKCVNVTKAMGQTMEAEGREWMCLYCKDMSLKRPKAAARRIRKASRTSSESASKASSVTSVTPVTMATAAVIISPSAPGSAPGCVVCGKRTRSSSIYCSDGCILRHAQNVEKVVVYDRKTHKLLTGAQAPSAANLDTWLQDHPSYEVVRTNKSLNTQKQQHQQQKRTVVSMTQSKLKLVRNDSSTSSGGGRGSGVSLAVQKKGVNIGVLKHGPIGQGQSGSSKIYRNLPAGMKLVSRQQKQQQPQQQQSNNASPKSAKLIPASNLPQYLTQQQHKQQQNKQPQTPLTNVKLKVVRTIQTKLNVPSTGSTPPSEKKARGVNVGSFIRDKAPGIGAKEKRPVPSKMPISRQAESSTGGGANAMHAAASKQENIREGIRKSLLEQLQNRLKLIEDLKLTDEELTKISEEIESQLYKCFGDTGQKYRNKYRSLIFNIKDLKNQTLWRKICEKAINPYQLVRLSSDDLASQELALWRERETKHQLDMIKKSELELMTCNRQYVFKTHKGEQVFEDETPKEKLTDVISDIGGDSSTLDRDKDGEKTNKDKDKKSSSSKNSRRERDRSKDRKDRKWSKDKTDSNERRRKKRSRSRERSDRDKRSRDRHGDNNPRRSSSHKSSSSSRRDRKDSSSLGSVAGKLDKKSTELLEQLVDKHILKPFEDKLWKHVSQDDLLPNVSLESDSDHEPTSTVTIPTPPRSNDPEDNTHAASSRTAVVANSNNDSSDDNKFDIPATPSPTPPQPLPPPPPAPMNQTAAAPGNNISSNSPSSSPSLSTIHSGHGPSSSLDYSSSSSSSSSSPLWRGTVNMVDVAEMSISAHEVSGDCSGLGVELPVVLDIVGRISPDTVWEYIGNMRSSNSKVISLLRLTETDIQEKMPYIALYSYLSSRNRLGVVKVMNKVIKDFYILPLASHKPIPQALLPLNGPGFDESRGHLLLGIVIRHKRKRPAIDPTTPTVKRVKVDVVIAPKNTTSTIKDISTINDISTMKDTSTIKVTSGHSGALRSYTPPPTRLDPRSKAASTLATSNAANRNVSSDNLSSLTKALLDEVYEEQEKIEDEEKGGMKSKQVGHDIESGASGSHVAEQADDDEPYSPEDSDPDSLIVPADSSRLNASDISSLLTGTVKTSSFMESGLTTSKTTFEPFTSKFDTIPGLEEEEEEEEDDEEEGEDEEEDNTAIPASTLELQRKMAELDQRIAIQKAEIDNMSHDIATTATATDIGTSVLANIALPSDLQQILANIKTIGGTGQAMGNRSIAPKSPSGHNYKWSPPDSLQSTPTPPPSLPSTDLTIPLLLPRLNSRNSPQMGGGGIGVAITTTTPLITAPSASIPLNLPPRLTKSSQLQTAILSSYDTMNSAANSISVLSTLTEEDLIRKAAEMLGEGQQRPFTATHSPAKRMKLDLAPPPPPMISSTTVIEGYQTVHQPPQPPLPPPLPPVNSTAPPVAAAIAVVTKKSAVELAQPPIPGLEDDLL